MKVKHLFITLFTLSCIVGCSEDTEPRSNGQLETTRGTNLKAEILGVQEITVHTDSSKWNILILEDSNFVFKYPNGIEKQENPQTLYTGAWQYLEIEGSKGATIHVQKRDFSKMEGIKLVQILGIERQSLEEFYKANPQGELVNNKYIKFIVEENNLSIYTYAFKKGYVLYELQASCEIEERDRFEKWFELMAETVRLKKHKYTL